MKNLELVKTAKTPYMKLTDDTLILTGRSYPEMAINYYKPIMDSINDADPFEYFSVYIDLEYINTSSNKVILYIIKNIADKTKNIVQIYWKIDEDDEAMFDLTEDYKSIIGNINIKTEIKY